MKPFVHKRGRFWRVTDRFGTSAVLYFTWRDAYNQARKYA